MKFMKNKNNKKTKYELTKSFLNFCLKLLHVYNFTYRNHRIYIKGRNIHTGKALYPCCGFTDCIYEIV